MLANMRGAALEWLTAALLRQLTAVNMRAAATGVGIIIADVGADVAVAVVVFVAAKVCVQRAAWPSAKSQSKAHKANQC